jgi:lysophospholipase L1-like esterase
LCWKLVNNASEGGTGYVNDGGAEGKSAIPTRLGDAVAGKPQLVIVEGGFNDDGFPPEQVTAAADRTFMDLRSALGPSPSIVVIGPVASPGKPATVLRPISDAIRQAAKKNGVLYVDPIEENWLAEPELFVSDGYHPNSAGHRQYASRLESNLKDIGASGCK